MSREHVRRLKVYAALPDDISNGHVWLKDPTFEARCIVRITNQSNSRSVYCEALQFDRNFVKTYNASDSGRVALKEDALESSIVMSYWYRWKLGERRHDGELKTQDCYQLEVTRAFGRWRHLRACLQHPLVVVRIATWLGMISVALGAIGAAPIFANALATLGGLARLAK